jgi:histidyl-tRNA synthetase
MGFKKDIQGMSATVTLTSFKTKSTKELKLKKPNLYFIQMGTVAKQKSLKVIETLRRGNIPVYHALTKDKLAAQLTTAENLKVPHILIMGQKESMEDTIVVREMTTRSQETVHLSLVSEYLKKRMK